MPVDAGGVAVKICGITRPGDAELALELGAHYLGLNFWNGSPRGIDVARGREIAAAVAGRLPLVGVFVNAPRVEIEDTTAAVGLALVQLSGDEDAVAIEPFAARAIKAFRAGAAVSAETVAPFAAAWAWLFDAAHPMLYGGSGRSWDFSALPLATWQAQGRRVFLAGGIGPDNVAAVLAGSRPQAIDVCSRVESSPGIKDAALLRRLFEEMKDVQAAALP